jgi:hypothetical protein
MAVVCSSSGYALAEQAAYARLTQVQGPVMVDTGSGFVQVAGDVELKLGDRVMVTKGGGAYLDFGANCTFPLEAPSMTTVTETACTTATQGGTGGGAVGAAVVGLGILGVGAFVLYVVLNDEDGQPLSP